MKKINNETILFEELLNKTHLSDPVTSEVKKFALKSEDIILKKILKDVGLWSISIGLGIKLFYLLKKLKLVVVTSKILSVITVATISVGTYYSVDYLTKIDNEKIIVDNKIENTVPLNEKSQISTPIIAKNRIELHKFTTSSADKKLLDVINNNINYELRSLRGNRVITNIKSDDKSIKYIITGNIEDLGEKIHFYIKIIDTRTSEIIHISNREIIKKGNMKQKCVNISKDLSSFLH